MQFEEIINNEVEEVKSLAVEYIRSTNWIIFLVSNFYFWLINRQIDILDSVRYNYITNNRNVGRSVLRMMYENLYILHFTSFNERFGHWNEEWYQNFQEDWKLSFWKRNNNWKKKYVKESDMNKYLCDMQPQLFDKKLYPKLCKYVHYSNVHLDAILATKNNRRKMKIWLWNDDRDKSEYVNICKSIMSGFKLVMHHWLIQPLKDMNWII